MTQWVRALNSKPVITAFGYEARSGKGECASHLAKEFSSSRVLLTSFAKVLRLEIHQEMQRVMAQHYCSQREALEIMCISHRVPFDAFAQADELNPYGKQRKLQQWWGTEFRRAQCPTYWLDRVADEIAEKKPDLVLIDDMRFINEANWVKEQGGYTVHVHRPSDQKLKGAEAAHISEHQLTEYAFDFKIVNDGSLSQLHSRAIQTYHQILQRKLF